MVSHLFRHEAGKMTAVLVRMFGFEHIEKAEDIVQDTLLKALNEWKTKLPDNPSAWLYKVARNQALDLIRREKVFNEITTELSYLSIAQDTGVDKMFLENEIQDSQLQMLFACCHPSIALESQITLSLKTLGGLNASEIAKAFLTTEDTINKRLYRAKEKIRHEKIKLAVPSSNELPARVDAVLKIIYLIFNEGYSSSHSNELIRQDLCEEAIRLGLLLTHNPLTNLPTTNALLALMCFQTARFPARLDDRGAIVLLKNQDRSLWNKFMTARAYGYLKKSAIGNEISEYHIEAGIASYHASATSFEQTNWEVILRLYNLLSEINASPLIHLNKAIVKGYISGPMAGIEALEKLEKMDANYIYQTAKGNFYIETGNNDLARECYQKALSLTISDLEKQLLQNKLANIDPSSK